VNLTPRRLSKDIINHIWRNLESNINMDKEQYQKWIDEIEKIIEVANSQYKYLGFFDGSARPNPGIMRIGGYIQAPNKVKEYTYSRNIGQGTNNIAEYRSLIHILEEAEKRGIQRFLVRGDSQLIIKQVNNEWKVKDPTLKELHSKAVEIMNKIPSCEISWHAREDNKEADKLANKG